jgi:uncharacterized iron-regulated membrane protein
MKRFLLKVHLWLSIPVGLIISIVSFSGAMLVFETELRELFNPERYKVDQIKEQALPIQQLVEQVQLQLPDTLTIAEVQVSNDPERNYRMGFEGRNRNAVFVDQYTGHIREMHVPGDDFFTTMRKLHRWLMDDYKRDSEKLSIGKTAVGVSTLFFVFILLTGIIVWIPKSRKALVRSFKIKTTKGPTRLWHDLHVTLGVYSAVILLALALTGLTWSFEWYNKAFYAVFGLEVPQRGAGNGAGQQQGGGAGVGQQRSEGRGQLGEGQQRSEGRGSVRSERTALVDEAGKQPFEEFMHWDKVVAELKALDTQHRTITLRGTTATVATDAIKGNKRATNRYTFDPESGKIVESTLYADQERAGKLRGWIYSVHVGSFGGMLTKVLFFLASMLGASLPLTGYYIWIRKSWKKRKRKK